MAKTKVTKSNMIKLTDIRIDDNLIIRNIDTHVLANYSEAMKAGDIFPPVIITKDNVLICGHHRYRAYRQVFGLDYSIPFEYTEYEDEADLIILSTQDNARHGRPLETFEKKQIFFRLKNLGVSQEDVASLLGVTFNRLEKWGDMNVVVVGGKNKPYEAPTKHGKEHLAGKEVNEKDYKEHVKKDSGHHFTFHINQVLMMLQRKDWIDIENEKTINMLKQLNKVLTEFLYGK